MCRCRLGWQRASHPPTLPPAMPSACWGGQTYSSTRRGCQQSLAVSSTRPRAKCSSWSRHRRSWHPAHVPAHSETAFLAVHFRDAGGGTQDATGMREGQQQEVRGRWGGRGCRRAGRAGGRSAAPAAVVSPWQRCTIWGCQTAGRGVPDDPTDPRIVCQLNPTGPPPRPMLAGVASPSRLISTCWPIAGEPKIFTCSNDRPSATCRRSGRDNRAHEPRASPCPADLPERRQCRADAAEQLPSRWFSGGHVRRGPAAGLHRLLARVRKAGHTVGRACWPAPMLLSLPFSHWLPQFFYLILIKPSFRLRTAL